MQLQRGDEYYLDGEGKPFWPLGMMLIWAFTLRGYLAWVITLTFSENRSKLIGYFYQTPEQFGLALLVGAPAFWALLLATFVKPGAPTWLLTAWRTLLPAMWFAWFADGVLIAHIISGHWPHFSLFKAGLFMAWLWSGWYLAKSRHLRAFLRLQYDFSR